MLPHSDDFKLSLGLRRLSVVRAVSLGLYAGDDQAGFHRRRSPRRLIHKEH
jgi:hypothetical protein